MLGGAGGADRRKVYHSLRSCTKAKGQWRVKVEREEKGQAFTWLGKYGKASFSMPNIERTGLLQSLHEKFTTVIPRQARAAQQTWGFIFIGATHHTCVPRLPVQLAGPCGS